ncbi:hypothetical protein B7L88_gp100 [Rhizobium phage RHEph10]|uniref:hypothetical protein n=1 Tax=Rhizobium phage RHEph10 TaxID=1220717 RepID=UPI0002AB02D2|nr:hypothetical protein B7L88_gp100 [Rhizobium phage RHEph10]AGC36188.1 hypothetical protein RHEph10_gp145 [Rhizobium phage RHEph10]
MNIADFTAKIVAVATQSDNQVTPFEGADCSPRIETFLSPVYIGIWLHQADTVQYHLEISNVVQPHAWLEDGVTRDGVASITAYTTFADVMTAYNAVITHIASSEANFHRI